MKWNDGRKSDVSLPKQMPEEDQYQVDIMTCAAPNLRRVAGNFMNPETGIRAADITEEELTALLRKRIRRSFAIAALEGNEGLILGVFGCGAYLL